MKKLVLLTAVMFAAMPASVFASSGTFGFGIELTGTGIAATNNGTKEIYALDNSGGSTLIPGSSTATISTAWTGSSTAAAPTFNLGTFLQTDTLTLDGGSMLTYKNGSSDVTGSDLFYRITSGATGATGPYASPVVLSFNANLTNPGDQRWLTESGATNLIAGLAPGTYTLSVYGEAFTSDGNAYENNAGPDFGATFTVVPEPSTWALMFGGLGVLVAFQRVRRLKV